MRGRVAISLALVVSSCAKEPAPPDPALAIANALFGPPEHGPQLLVTVDAHGDGAAHIEREVIEPLEHAIAKGPAVAEIESIATPGRARLYVSFASGSDPSAAMQTLREAIQPVTLPEWARHPEITRADRDGAVMFVMLGAETPGDADRPGEHDAMRELGQTLLLQPGVTEVRECGFARRVAVIEIDPRKLLSFGITVDALGDYLTSKVTTALDVGPDSMLEALSSPLDGMTRVMDLVALRIDLREGECQVLGTRGRAHPTLRVRGTADAIAKAQQVVNAAAIAPRVRTWTPGDGASTTANVDARPRPAEWQLLRWLAHDETDPAWLVRDGDEPAWLLAGPRTPLRSFGLAASEGLHVWWPGAAPPVTVRICGADLDTLVQTSDALAAKLRTEDRLDDVAVWAPRMVSEVVVRMDPEALARHGVSATTIAPYAALLVGGELRLTDHAVVRVPDPSPLPLRGRDGIVMSDSVITRRDEAVPSFITRVNRERCAKVDLRPRQPEHREQIETLVREQADLPVGVTLTFAAR
jgi:hypothetical protein